MIKLIEMLCSSMKDIQESISKKLYGRIEEESTINKNVDLELKRTKGEVEDLKVQMDKLRLEHEEQKASIQERYDGMLHQRDSQIEKLEAKSKELEETV